MSAWQPGDLAVCVDVVPRSFSDLDNLALLKEGVTYEVRAVVCWGMGLSLTGVPSRNRVGFWADRFRKVVSDQHEPCEEEFVTLLKRNRVSA